MSAYSKMSRCTPESQISRRGIFSALSKAASTPVGLCGVDDQLSGGSLAVGRDQHGDDGLNCHGRDGILGVNQLQRGDACTSSRARDGTASDRAVQSGEGAGFCLRENAAAEARALEGRLIKMINRESIFVYQSIICNIPCFTRA